MKITIENWMLLTINNNKELVTRETDISKKFFNTLIIDLSTPPLSTRLWLPAVGSASTPYQSVTTVLNSSAINLYCTYMLSELCTKRIVIPPHLTSVGIRVERFSAERSSDKEEKVAPLLWADTS